MIQKLPYMNGNRQPYHRPNDPFIEVEVPAVDGKSQPIIIRQRSLRQMRTIFTWSITTFMLGALLIVISSPYRAEILAPGDLSSTHSQILAAEGADRCAACHAAANQSFSGWVSSALFGHDAATPTQSDLCMKCHENGIRNELALRPHGVDEDTLQKSADSQTSSSSFQTSLRLSPPLDHGNIGCNACHREHHGSDANLAAMTDAQCQTCHQNQFRAFELDHPEFDHYVSKRRSRIAFDHTSHSLKHFPEAAADFNCNRCHLDDDNHNVKQLAPFEQSCASCHDQKIKESASQGLVLFSLPMLDMEAIGEQQKSVGSWPLTATGDFDGGLSPLMRLLLAADEKVKPILDDLPLAFDFSDVDPDDAKAVADTVELAWAIKRLLHELSTEGVAALERRIELALHIDATEAQLALVTPKLNRYAFTLAAQRWLPNLKTELEQRQANSKNTLEAGEKPTASHMRETNSTVPLESFKVAATDTWWPRDGQLLAKMAATMPQQEPGDVLAQNPLTGLMRDPLNKNPVQGTAEPNMTASETKALSPAELVSSEPEPETTPSGNSPLSEIEPFTPTETSSGWIRNDETFVISYLPDGHADTGLKQWIEWAAASRVAPTSQTTAPLFHQLMLQEGIGNCRSCHTAETFRLDSSILGPSLKVESALNRFVAPTDEVTTRMKEKLPTTARQTLSTEQLTLQRLTNADQGENAFALPALRVNWQSVTRNPAQRGFTKFSHSPHLIQPGLRDCFQCHQIDPEKSNAASFIGFDPTSFESNFVPIQVANCASCHREGSTTNSCTTCHNYHVGYHK